MRLKIFSITCMIGFLATVFVLVFFRDNLFANILTFFLLLVVTGVAMFCGGHLDK